MSKPKERCAFIDVQNTASTAQQLLGFIIDWNRLCTYLKVEWNCSRVFLYSGIENGDVETANEFQALAGAGYIVRAKTVFAYKNKDRSVQLKCIKCGADNAYVIDMGYNRKSNCDVELSVDMLEEAKADREFLLFTGDGDFEYLVRKIIEKGVTVKIVSNASMVVKPGLIISRFSTKLRDLIAKNRGVVDFVNIDSWRERIKKKAA